MARVFADQHRGQVEWSAVASNGAYPVYHGGFLVQLAGGHPGWVDADVAGLHPATIELTDSRLVALADDSEWSWLLTDVEEVFHGTGAPWTILSVPGVPDHGVAVSDSDVAGFRLQLERLLPHSTKVHHQDTGDEAGPEPLPSPPPRVAPEPPPVSPPATALPPDMAETAVQAPVAPLSELGSSQGGRQRPSLREGVLRLRSILPRRSTGAPPAPAGLARLEARNISAWFGNHHVLDNVSLDMAAGEVTALIGPSGCGKSTFLRILNRMHELIPSASLAGSVLLEDADIYDPARKVTDARRQIGMVFQKPNPFPAMSIYDNVLASFQVTGLKVSSEAEDEIVESCLRKAGLWNEVRERLRQPGGGLSGGQQQRLCIARALAIRPQVLLMDEPCSALDPTSTRRIEQTIAELASEVTIVIVTHNMQQAARVSNQCAFFLAEQGTPGVIVEHGPTDAMFNAPQDPRTNDYVNGRFG